ncbi:HNH endonuclease signature motif containing protein [Variovorax paradoxus]|uniref:HNH endonuclease signature motif containing protein n=1 Tax=Variovorax paradoxus TaxID=34073 RepID=UPI001932EEB9|nr:HNH endonuclease [Variovorax paradoxus]
MSHAPQPSWRTDRRKTAERGYGGRWQRERKAFLSREENALCVMCKSLGRITPATVVDHKVKHEGDQALMWDQSNWQPLCKPHHDSDKQMFEKSGRSKKTIGPDGWPS